MVASARGISSKEACKRASDIQNNEPKLHLKVMTLQNQRQIVKPAFATGAAFSKDAALTGTC
jgi:hypothetical protein